jgi:hypothetical protein
MKSFLEVYTERQASLGFPRAQILGLLLSHNEDAEKVRNWIKQHAGAGGEELDNN